METATLTPSLAELRASLPGLMLRDQRRLSRRAERAAALHDAAAREQALRQVLAEREVAAARVAMRRLAVPVISYPPELPVSQRREQIAAAIAEHQVLIVAGETGSGKTTQLPKICLELGRGVTGQIGHTQPRRIAARTVAERIAAELGTELGTTVGYKMRFADTSSNDTMIKLMTDGILLTEMQHDRQLLRYDTLIIDEAHERSLNIDFILGYLKRLLPSRPDLKVIITSATIDTARFSAHFGGGESSKHRAGGEHGGAPVIEVSGRSYPVQMRYRPLADPDDQGAEPRDQVQAICDAVDELRGEGGGDILVFLSGEREIRDAADALAGQADLEVLPLYARLSAAEQHRVFAPHTGRRVVLATNVAETSLTVPGIKYVVDPGTARISRYSRRTKVQRLPIEPISRASADQRAGRCGRTSDGICVRLYSEADYAARPEYTDPEILRTHLASVILRMAALDLGEVTDFPFVDPPAQASVADGVRLLTEIGAFTQGQAGTAHRLTEIGRKLAQLPADPRLGRMILEADRNGCAREVIIIAAALSITEPRERPADARAPADAMHARFAEPGSDFLAYLNLWDYLHDQQRELSGSAFRRMCRREYLHFLRVREWQDVCGQLRQAASDVGMAVGRDRGPAAPAQADLADRVHRSLLAGLLSQIGMRLADQPQRGKRRPLTEFAGPRGTRFAIFPDSGLAAKPPPWVAAAELVETSRLWARTVARIEPEWVEPLAGHLVRRSYSDPRWDSARGCAVAAEKVTLYGLPVITGRMVTLGRVDPVLARELFIRCALVEGDWQTNHRFFAGNRQVLADAQELQRRARRPGPDLDSLLFGCYDRVIPAEVTSARHFDTWWNEARPADPGLLDLDPELVAGAGEVSAAAQDYPGSWGGLELSYEFDPGTPADGVTVEIPLARLNQVGAEEFGWQIPGLREELLTELIRSLPKQLRRLFVPAPQTARAVLARLGDPSGDLLAALSAELSRVAGTPVPADAWDLSRLPAHLRVTFQVTDGGQVLASGKDLAGLRAELRPRLTARLNDAAAGLTRTGLRSWAEVGSLPRMFSHGEVRAYPALEDAGDAVDIVLCETQAQAAEAMRRGSRRLLLITVPSGARSVASRLPVSAKLAMSRGPHQGASALLDDCAACAADELIAASGGPAWDAAGFERLLDAARAGLAVATVGVVSDVARVLTQAQQVEVMLGQLTSPVLAPALADVRSQLSGLIYPGFVSLTGSRRLPDVVRYLRGIARRLQKMPDDPGRDAASMAVVHQVSADYQRTLGQLGPAKRQGAAAAAVRWMIEELRVSLFAQTVGTPVPVSEKRIRRELDRLAAVSR